MRVHSDVVSAIGAGGKGEHGHHHVHHRRDEGGQGGQGQACQGDHQEEDVFKQIVLWHIVVAYFLDREHLVGLKLITCSHPGPTDQEDGHGAEDEEGGDGSPAEESQSGATESCLQCAHFVTHPDISNPRQI